MYLGTMVDDMFLDTPQFEFGARGLVTLDSEGNLPFDSVGTDANDGEDVSVMFKRWCFAAHDGGDAKFSRTSSVTQYYLHVPRQNSVALAWNGNRVV